ncbi:hypothetical protein IWX88_000231 [Frigoribacterium sp. CG_9.8]|nr:hypothetical protein [Frigoribacterium sp. CG_9.8]
MAGGLIPSTFTEAQRSRITFITTPPANETAIWKWLNDPLNESDIKAIASLYLLSVVKLRQRSETREKEREVVASPRPETTSVRPTPAPSKSEGMRQRLRESGVPAGKLRKGDPVIVGDTFINEAWFQLASGKKWLSNNPELLGKAEAIAHEVQAEWQKSSGRSDPGVMFRQQLSSTISDYGKGLRASWDAKLLSEEFAVDGISVKWGSATKEQHRKRADSLEKHALGTARTAALHLAAIRDIDNIGAHNLDDVFSSVNQRRDTP